MNSHDHVTEQVWRLLSDKLKSFLTQRVSDEQVAEDLLQETFVRIHRKLGDIDDMQRLTSWVFQIARNLVVDYYRSKARDMVALADDLETQQSDDSNLNDLVAGWLPQMVSQLPDTYREAVRLYELKGVSQQEIARQMGISLSGAKSRVQRGREKLKGILLDCCAFERDRLGNVIGYVQKNSECDGCDSC